MIAPWASEEGKLSLLRNASALNANQTMALVDRHGTITAPTLVLWGMPRKKWVSWDRSSGVSVICPFDTVPCRAFSLALLRYDPDVRAGHHQLGQALVGDAV